MSDQPNCADFALPEQPGEEPSKSDGRKMGSRERVNGWFNEWCRPLRRFLAGRHSIPTNDLDDVVQEVYLRLLRYDRTEAIEQPQAYMFKMAANIAIEFASRSRTGGVRDMAWLEEYAPDEATEEELRRLENEEEVSRALLVLRPRQREILKLQFFEGLTHAQTAERLGVSERVVKRTLAKTYRRLRGTLLPA